MLRLPDGGRSAVGGVRAGLRCRALDSAMTARWPMGAEANDADADAGSGLPRGPPPGRSPPSSQRSTHSSSESPQRPQQLAPVSRRPSSPRPPGAGSSAAAGDGSTNRLESQAAADSMLFHAPSPVTTDWTTAQVWFAGRPPRAAGFARWDARAQRVERRRCSDMSADGPAHRSGLPPRRARGKGPEGWEVKATPTRWSLDHARRPEQARLAPEVWFVGQARCRRPPRFTHWDTERGGDAS